MGPRFTRAVAGGLVNVQPWVACAAWGTAARQPSTRRGKGVHCHEPLPGEKGIRTGVRERVAQPRLAVDQGGGVRRIPPAQGPEHEDFTLYASHTVWHN